MSWADPSSRLIFVPVLAQSGEKNRILIKSAIAERPLIAKVTCRLLSFQALERNQPRVESNLFEDLAWVDVNDEMFPFCVPRSRQDYSNLGFMSKCLAFKK